jgi:hypothetical protein
MLLLPPGEEAQTRLILLIMDMPCWLLRHHTDDTETTCRKSNSFPGRPPPTLLYPCLVFSPFLALRTQNVRHMYSPSAPASLLRSLPPSLTSPSLSCSSYIPSEDLHDDRNLNGVCHLSSLSHPSKHRRSTARIITHDASQLCIQCFGIPTETTGLRNG